MASNESTQPTRTPEQIEADLAAARLRLAHSAEDLSDTVHPNRIKQRGVARLKVLAAEYTEKAKSLVFNARGDLRTTRVATAGGGLVGFITLVTLLRRRA